MAEAFAREARCAGEKAKIVREAQRSGAMLHEVTQRHGLHPSPLTRRRAQGLVLNRKAGRREVRLVPVTVEQRPRSESELIRPDGMRDSASTSGCIDVEFAAGPACAHARGSRCLHAAHAASGVGTIMISAPTGVPIGLAAGFTDPRKGFDGLAALVQTVLNDGPFSGQIYVFRGRLGDLIKLIWDSQDGLCLFQKRLRHGKLRWPQAQSGTVCLSAVQLSMLLEGIVWVRRETDARLRVQVPHGEDLANRLTPKSSGRDA